MQEGKGNIDTAAEAIIESAQNMQNIVNDVLDFSKPVRLELKEEDMRNVIEQASEACRAKAEDRGITLSVDIPGVSVLSEVDSFNMQRALINLINNAIEASGKGQDVKIALAAKKKIYSSGSRTMGQVWTVKPSKTSSFHFTQRRSAAQASEW